MAKKILKTYIVKPRYERNTSESREFILTLWQTGITGKKRVIRFLSNQTELDDDSWEVEYNPNNLNSSKLSSYILQDEDGYVFEYLNEKRTKQYLKNNNIPENNSSLDKTLLAKWTPLDKDGKKYSETFYGDIKKLEARTPIDKKYHKYNGGYYPPYYEILKVTDGYDGWSITEQNGKDTISFSQSLLDGKRYRRSFGFDKYWLNNGAEIEINWLIDPEQRGVEFFTVVAGGKEWSNNWGEELDIRNLGLSPNSDSDIVRKPEIRKKIKVIIPESELQEGKPFYFGWLYKGEFKEVQEIISGNTVSRIERFDEEIGFSYPTDSPEDTTFLYDKFWENIEDKVILNEVVRKWQQKYGNTKLKIEDNEWGYYTNKKPPVTLEWLLPTEEYSEPVVASNLSQTGSTGSSQSQAGLSASGLTPSAIAASPSISGTFIFDVTKKDIFFEPKIGELFIIEKVDVDPFVFSDIPIDDDLSGLDAEYIEEQFGDGNNIYTKEELDKEKNIAVELNKKLPNQFQAESEFDPKAKAEYVKRRWGDLKKCTSDNPKCPKNPPSTPYDKSSKIPAGFNGVPLYWQTDLRWGGTSFDYSKVTKAGPKTQKGDQCIAVAADLKNNPSIKNVGDPDQSTVSTSGCCPSAISMVINYWADQGKCKPVTPDYVALFLSEYGGRNCGNGSLVTAIPQAKFKEQFGLNIIADQDSTSAPNLKKDLQQRNKAFKTWDQVIMAALKKGYPCVISGGGYIGLNYKGQSNASGGEFPKKYGGHFLCLTGIDDQNRIRVNDSGRAPDHEGEAITAFLPNKKPSESQTSVRQRVIIFPNGYWPWV
jgi:hypothetical protein